MKNGISDALNSVLLFFGGSFVDIEKIYPIRSFLGLAIIEMATLGNCEINQKHKSHYSHLIISNLGETLKIVFVYNHLFTSDSTKNLIAMFCVIDNNIWEYKSNKQRTFLSADEFDGYDGLNMLTVAKKFCEGVVEDDLIVSENELIKDIVAYSKSVA